MITHTHTHREDEDLSLILGNLAKQMTDGEMEQRGIFSSQTDFFLFLA